jgi:hypothetical protein
MSHQGRVSNIIVNHQTIKQVVDEFFPSGLFVGMKTRSGASWKVRMLTVAALVWAISGMETLTDRFKQARKIVAKVFRWQRPPGTTYQGFIKMLNKWHDRLMAVIIPHIRQLMQEMLPEQWELEGYVVFATDGSRVELSRTKSLEKVYSPSGLSTSLS